MNRLALLIGGVVAVAASRADAIPDCSTLQNPVYMQVGDTQTNLMKALGRKLRDNTSNPITMVFVTNGSCTNIDVMYNHTATMSGTIAPSFAPSIAENPNWNPATDALSTCNLPAGQFPDIGNSAVFNSSCTTAAPPATVTVTDGPIQAYVLAVPTLSDQTAITAEEAYFVFGFGMAGMIAPWTDEMSLFIRTTTKSTLLTWSNNINVPANKWKGIMFANSSDVVSNIENTQSPEVALGILGDEVYDGARNKMKVLAFRAYQQYAAYYPDSTFTARDKKNIRDGHYTVWSPTTWMENVDAGGQPVNALAHYVIGLIVGVDVTPAPTNFAAPDVVAGVGLVPDCAMAVQRSFDGGPLSLYSPAESCVCRYEATVATTSCATCSDSSPCGTGTCRNGYCEAQ